ncbi:conserved unknown protein [Ectocarpus siliculosus]|uniref:Uncharacterized protein n=1 Tax=Ectocarpus siliculosus TaxID=2880 RepID=D8LNL6_ECTSI|nr:conserved unknown protein [Ectocarpus siliculosus]|eukprot:CBN78226.1 conserved unknown protein [Ectocarpus siliculosus]
MKGGKYSNTESKIVVDAIKSYASANAITVDSLCQDGSRSVGSKRAWLSIANCLPDRSVQSIYRHGIRQLHGRKMGAWTDEEVAQLKLLVSTHGKKWSEIGKKVGRSADACRDKSRELISTPQEGPWTEQEEKLLNKLMMDRMECGEDMSEVMLTGNEEVDVPWAEVARIIKSRNRIACRKKWDYLQMQRRQKWQYVRDTRGSAASINLAFVKAIIGTGAADESELNWSSLPYPRANLKWKNLRERELQAPNANLQFREALNAVRGRLQREVDDEKKAMDQAAQASPSSAAVAAPTVAFPLSDAGSGSVARTIRPRKARREKRERRRDGKRRRARPAKGKERWCHAKRNRMTARVSNQAKTIARTKNAEKRSEKRTERGSHLQVLTEAAKRSTRRKKRRARSEERTNCKISVEAAGPREGSRRDQIRACGRGVPLPLPRQRMSRRRGCAACRKPEYCCIGSHCSSPKALNNPTGIWGVRQGFRGYWCIVLPHLGLGLGLIKVESPTYVFLTFL